MLSLSFTLKMLNSLLLRLADNFPDSVEDNLGEKNNAHDFIDEIVMLLSSRPRLGYIESIPGLNTSVLNYGINEHFSENISRTERARILQERIVVALQRFESRLQDVDVTSNFESLSRITFIIKGVSQNQPLEFTLVWDDAMSHFFCHY
ncbi:GPW/gp25 family protein [Hafnia paralvei]|uniref:GPW/gp25 family protein n=1 Tax=Hafnia paralvei TaxID=546367 RepID=UPI0024A941C4|nr:GPW/gp25 family protein [Hafnia paralvei]